MISLYDDLSEKLKKDPRVSKRGGTRYDLGLLLFNARNCCKSMFDNQVLIVWQSRGHRRNVQLCACPKN